MSSLPTEFFSTISKQGRVLAKIICVQTSQRTSRCGVSGARFCKVRRNPPESDGAPINKQRDKYRNQTLDNGESIQEIQ